MELAKRYIHNHRMWGVMCDYVFSTPDEAVQAARAIQDEYHQPAGAWLAENYYMDVEKVYVVASGASYWNARKYLGLEIDEKKGSVFMLEIVEKGLYSAPFKKVEDGELGRSGMVVRISSEELGYTSPKFYFQAWGAGLESEERFVGALAEIDKALHMLNAYEEIGHDGGDMNAIIAIFATA